jgi:cold shock protein
VPCLPAIPAARDALAPVAAPGIEARPRRDVTGTIKRIVRDKGFGFITPDDGSGDVFFHRSQLAPRVEFDELREGDEVEFQTRAGDKGPQAMNVKVR